MELPQPELEPTAEPEPERRPRVYVACLAAYNDGKLHGEYLDAAVTPGELWRGISGVLRTSPVPMAEEWAIHDHEGFEGIRIPEYSSVERVTTLAKLVQLHGEAFSRWYMNDESVDLETAGEAFEEAFIGEFEDEDALAAHIEEDFGIEQVMEDAERNLPEWMRLYVKFDTEAYVRDLGFNGDLFTAEGSNGSTFAYWSR